MNEKEEKILIERSQSGDTKAFSLLIESFQDMVYRVCLGLLRDAQKAEEAAQDVFIRVYEKLGSFRGESRLSTWIYRVTLNQCRNSLRKSFWHKWLSLEKTKGISNYPSPEIIREGKELREHLLEALEKLPLHFREPIVLRFLEEKEYSEISKILGIRIGTVESRLFRGKKKLKNILMQREEK